jgi:hypothetical protein
VSKALSGSRGLCYGSRMNRLSIGWFCAILFWGGALSAQADFYVATNGSDQNEGSEAKPFLSLERAREAVRQGKGAGVTVWIRGGDYIRTNTFELSAEDSGSSGQPISWRAFGNERVRLLGGKKLTGFSEVTDTGTLGRFDEKARGHVLQLNLRALGISDFGEMKSRGFARPTTPAHCELFFAGRPMTLARWPNEGEWQKITGFPETGEVGDEHGGKIGDLKEGFFYQSDRPHRWRDSNDIWVHGYWAWDWANSYERVAELNRERQFVRTAAPHGLYGFRKGQRFYFLNILEELDEPGEWFLDRKDGVLYFWPPDADALKKKSAETFLSLLSQPLVRLNGASNVVLRGLILEGTRANAVEIHGGESNLVAGCVIRSIGDIGVTIDGGKGNGVSSCDIFDTGDGGVTLNGGDRQTLAPGGNFVENTHFQRQGRWSKCYVPAILISGVGQRASHNLIHDHPHAAILFGGNDHLIDFNEIHHIALETGDVGAIYAGRDYSIRGNRIRHNYLHETGGIGMGSMGVYMDDCMSGAEVFGNVFYKVHWAMFIGGGRDHRVENNIFVDCDPAVRADGRGLDKSPVWRDMVNDYMRKQLTAVPLALYREHYPAMKSLDAYYGPPEGPAIAGDNFKGVPPEGNVIAHNVAVGKWFEAGWHANKDMFDVRDNFVTSDPKQIGKPSEGFRLPKDSPAWALGFKEIPFEQIGIQKNPDRERLALIGAN